MGRKGKKPKPKLENVGQSSGQETSQQPFGSNQQRQEHTQSQDSQRQQGAPRPREYQHKTRSLPAESPQIHEGQQLFSKASFSSGQESQSDERASLRNNTFPSSSSSLTGQVSKINLDTSSETHQLQIPERKNYLKAGTSGTLTTVLVNMLKIKLSSNFPEEVYHYDVQFEPDRPKYLFRNIFKQAQELSFPKHKLAFDGKKNAYSRKILFSDTSMTIDLIFNDIERDRELKFKVKFVQVNILNFSWLKNIKAGLKVTDGYVASLQAFNVILSNAATAHPSTVSVGRSHFCLSKPVTDDLGHGLSLRQGLFQSAVVGWKLLLNVDVANKAFPKNQTVIDFLKEILKVRDLHAQIIQRNLEWINSLLKKELKGLRIRYELKGGNKTIKKTRQLVNSLTAETPTTYSFNTPNGNTTIKDYFLNNYNYTIVHENYPCIHIGPKDKKTYVPIELCRIEQGTVLDQRKLGPKIVANMIRNTALATPQRQKKILENFGYYDHNNNALLREFGITINKNFEEVPARILDSPELRYQNSKVKASRGQWNIQRQNFLQPTMLIKEKESWTILNLTNYNDRQLHVFSKKLIAKGRELGMNISEPTCFTHVSVQFNHRANLRMDLKKEFVRFKQQNIRLVIVFFSDKVPLMYETIKQVAELKDEGTGILTSCIKDTTFRNFDDMKSNMTFVNILHKVNAKLNGVNHGLAPEARPACLNEPCMIVGADVTHPSPDAKMDPSLAAVAASFDFHAFRYKVEMRRQPSKKEIIEDLENVIKLLLQNFQSQNKGKLPKRIIFYRDGVSESQFQQVLSEEIQALKKACSAMELNYNPKITFLVVQKRHHTRFFPVNKEDSDDYDKNCNVKAGMVVDTEITHPTDIDFYLQSHASIKGTARPTKYRLLYNDDPDMNEDEIEKLSYFLCHLISRCTRSISYPAPTYYAHLAAARARALTKNDNIDVESLPLKERKLWIHGNLEDKSMFFN